MSNFTNNRWFTAVILLLLTANIVTLAFLWTSRNKEQHSGQFLPPQGRGNEVFEFLTHELQLDPAQQETYRKMRDEHRAGAKALQDSIRQAKDALFELLKQQDVPDSVIAAYSKKASGAEQKLDEFTFRHFQKLRSICNKVQQEKFDKIIQDALKRMAPRRPGPPPPGMHHPEDGPPGPPAGNKPI